MLPDPEHKTLITIIAVNTKALWALVQTQPDQVIKIPLKWVAGAFITMAAAVAAIWKHSTREKKPAKEKKHEVSDDTMKTIKETSNSYQTVITIVNKVLSMLERIDEKFDEHVTHDKEHVERIDRNLVIAAKQTDQLHDWHKPGSDGMQHWKLQTHGIKELTEAVMELTRNQKGMHDLLKTQIERRQDNNKRDQIAELLARLDKKL